MGGTPPPRPILKIFSSLRTRYVNFIRIAPVLRVVSIQVKKTHILVFVSLKSVQIYSSYRVNKKLTQGTGYDGLTLTPPKIDEFVF